MQVRYPSASSCKETKATKEDFICPFSEGELQAICRISRHEFNAALFQTMVETFTYSVFDQEAFSTKFGSKVLLGTGCRLLFKNVSKNTDNTRVQKKKKPISGSIASLGVGFRYEAYPWRVMFLGPRKTSRKPFPS